VLRERRAVQGGQRQCERNQSGLHVRIIVRAERISNAMGVVAVLRPGFGKSLRKKRGQGRHSEKMKHLMKDYGLTCREGLNAGKPVQYFRLYDLWHTFATRLGRQGHSATILAAIMGWSSTRMAMRYVHHDMEDKARAIATLNPTAAGEVK